MRRPERVIPAFGAFAVAGEPAALADRMHPAAASGENPVRVNLVSDISDDLDPRRFNGVMQRGSQFGDTEPDYKMAAGL